VTSEDDEEEAQSSQLHQRLTEHMDTDEDEEDEEHCGRPEPGTGLFIIQQGSRLRPNGRILRLKLDTVPVNFSSTRACATSKIADYLFFCY